MAIPNIAIVTPIRPSTTSYVLRVTCNAIAENLSFPATVANRDYWITGDGQTGTESDGSGRADLLTMFQTMLRTHTQAPTATVTLVDGKVVASSNDTDWTFHWTHASSTLPAEWFGWTEADTASSATQTAPDQAQGLFFPDRPIAFDSRDRQPVTGGIARTLSGKTRVSSLGTPKKERDIVLRFINKTNALTEYTTSDRPKGAFEWVWLNAIGLGWPLRIYEDESALSTTEYSVYRTRDLNDPLKRNEAFPVFWDIDLKLAKELSVSFSNGQSFRINDTATAAYIDFGDVSTFDGVTKCTWSFWLKQTAFPTVNVGVITKRATNNNQFEIEQVGSSGTCRIHLTDTLTSLTICQTFTSLFTTGVWQHIVCVYDASLAGANRFKLYKNGVLQTPNTTPATPPASIASGGTAAYRLSQTFSGANGTWEQWFDEVAVWANAAATQEQVTSLYNNGTPANAALVGLGTPNHYHRAEGNYTDSGSGGATGTPSGDVTFSTDVPG